MMISASKEALIARLCEEESHCVWKEDAVVVEAGKSL